MYSKHSVTEGITHHLFSVGKLWIDFWIDTTPEGYFWKVSGDEKSIELYLGYVSIVFDWY